MKIKIAHISAVSRSVENADSFYIGILGLSKVKDFSIEAKLTDKIFGIPCQCRILVYAHLGEEIEVFIPDVFPEQRNPFDHVCLEVDDKKSFVQSCKKRDVQVNMIAKGDKFLTFIKDFDGNLFEIKEIAGVIWKSRNCPLIQGKKRDAF